MAWKTGLPLPRAAWIAAVAAVGCAGVRPNVFFHPKYNFAFVERVAVIPFENLSEDKGSALRVTRLVVADLLSRKAFDIVEPGDVAKALEKQGVVRTADLPREAIIGLGRELKVQALMFGTVNESTSQRSGSVNVSLVTLVVRFVETEEGSTIWSATHTAGGRGFWRTLFGLDAPAKGIVTRKCVRDVIGTLFD